MEVDCSNDCGERHKKRLVVEHLNNCPKRLVSCDHCTETVLASDLLVSITITSNKITQPRELIINVNTILPLSIASLVTEILKFLPDNIYYILPG